MGATEAGSKSAEATLSRATAVPSPRAIPPPRAETLHAPSGRKPALIAALAIVGIFAHLFLRYALRAPTLVWQMPLFIVLTLGGVPLTISLLRKLLAREFGSDHLAGISIVASVLLREYLVGAIVILMLSGGTTLEQFASRKASSVLDARPDECPKSRTARKVAFFAISGSKESL